MMAAKVAVVTGAAQGIGRRTAEMLGERGYTLALADIQSCAGTLASLRAFPGQRLELLGDVSQEETVRGMAESVRARFRRVPTY